MNFLFTNCKFRIIIIRLTLKVGISALFLNIRSVVVKSHCYLYIIVLANVKCELFLLDYCILILLIM